MADAKRIAVGYPVPFTMTNPSFSNFALNANNDQFEAVFQAEEAATLTRLAVRLGTITGTTPTYKISLQGVDSSGNPDGTIKGGGSPASKTFSPSSLGWAAGSLNWLTLDNSYVCTRGESLALVVAYDSGTVDGSNNASFSSAVFGPNATQFPYTIQNDATVRTRQSNLGVFGYGSASKPYGFPISAATTLTMNSAQETGMKFTLPSGWGDTYKVRGLRFSLRPSTAAVTMTARIYEGGGAADTTVLQDATFDLDFVTSTGALRQVELFFDEATLATLTYGSTYRVVLAIAGSITIIVPYFEVASAADWDAFANGQDFQWTTRNGGSWTDTATRRGFVELILDDVTEPAGGTPGGCPIIGGSIVRAA